MRRQDFNSPEYRRLHTKQILDKIHDIQRKQELEKEAEEKERLRLEKKAKREEKRKKRGTIKNKNLILSLAFGISALSCLFSLVSVLFFCNKSTKALNSFKKTEEYQEALRTETKAIVEKYERKEIDEIEFVNETKDLESKAIEKLLNSKNDELKKEYKNADKSTTAASIVGLTTLVTSTSIASYEIAKANTEKNRSIFNEIENEEKGL